MDRPVCTRPLTSISHTILDGDKPIPVAVAGYCIKQDKQYKLRIRSINPKVQIEAVIIQNEEPVEINAQHCTETHCDAFFKIRDFGWRFLPFRFVPATLSLYAEVSFAGYSPQTITVPVVVFNSIFDAIIFIRVFFFAMVAILGFLFAYFGFQLPTILKYGLAISFIFLWPFGAFVWYHFGVLKNRARQLRTGEVKKDANEL